MSLIGNIETITIIKISVIYQDLVQDIILTQILNVNLLLQGHTQVKTICLILQNKKNHKVRQNLVKDITIILLEK